MRFPSIPFLKRMNLALAMIVVIAVGIAVDSRHWVFYVAAIVGLVACVQMLRHWGRAVEES